MEWLRHSPLTLLCSPLVLATKRQCFDTIKKLLLPPDAIGQKERHLVQPCPRGNSLHRDVI
jgi:hypothetical protein